MTTPPRIHQIREPFATRLLADLSYALIVAALAGAVAASAAPAEAQVSSASGLGTRSPVTAITADVAGVTVTTPTANTQYLEPAVITVAVAAPGNTAQVDFYANGTKVGSTRNWPFTLKWSAVPAGSYTLTVVALDSRGVANSSGPVPVLVKGIRNLPLVQKSAFRRLGAFRLPAGTFGGSSFGYNGPIAFNPGRNSLFMVGHDWHQFVGEVSIPELRTSASVADLAVASVLQPFADPIDGKSALVNPGDPNPIKVGGLLPYQGKLITSEYAYYDGGGRQTLSHFVSTPDLSRTNDAQGPFQVTSPLAGYVSGYMGTIPTVWQGAMGATALTGQCCIAIVGRTSSGPALFAFNPGDVGTVAPIPARPLVYYPEANATLGPWGNTSATYNGSSKITGVVFPEGTRSVLFFGRHGLGTFCYGTGAECADPTSEDKGVHAYPYVYQVWAYDAAELVEVKNGARQPWSVRPYAVWQLEFPTTAWSTSITGATYDAVTGRLFLSQGFVDGSRPVVHVYALDVAP